MNNDSVGTYLLVDNGLLHGRSASYTEVDPDSRPSWLVPIYPDQALAASPFLVDIEAAYEAGDLDRAMRYLNACTPPLHVSIVETKLDLEQLARHLRRFIFILDPEARQFTLRYADCTILASLSSILTSAQWATMRGPIARWGVHDRSGAVIHLPRIESGQAVPTPLCLDQVQLAALDEASEPDHYIAKVNAMRHGAALPGNTAERHTWAQAARNTWRSADNSNPNILMFLTEAALVSRGKILHPMVIGDLLTIVELDAFRRKLRELTEDFEQQSFTTARET